jgi:RNA polymerase sigma-70 factor, ECF subfamily
MDVPANLERMYDEHAQALFSFLLNMTRNESETRDLLQELFVKLASRGLPADVRDERAFLLRLAHNVAVDRMRRRSTRERTAEAFGEQQTSIFEFCTDADEQIFRQALSEAVAELPPNQRAVVHLKLWEGMTFEAIAAILEISANTAASRHRYAIDKLRQRLRLLYEEIK